MTRHTGDTSPSEAPSRADVHENQTQPKNSEWGNISHQSLSDNSQWNAARGGKPADASLDKKALGQGVLEFGSIHDVINKTGGTGEAAAKGLATDGSPAKPGSPEAAKAGSPEAAKAGSPEAAKAGSPEAAKAGSPEAAKTGSPEAAKAGAPEAAKTGSPEAAKTGAPEANAGKPGDDKAATLFSKNSTDEQKLAAARDLAKSGTTDVNYRDSQGNDHKAHLELEKAGNKDMVHVYAPGADGKDHTALRGISKADGTFEHERDKSGNFVGYQAKGYAGLGADGGATPGDVKPAQPAQPATPGDVRPAQPDQPATPGDVRPAQPDQPATPGDVKPVQPAQPATPGDVKPAQPATPGDLKLNLPELPKLSLVEPPRGAVDRSQFDSQLQDPKVMAAFAGRMNSEVGTQGHAAQVAFAEEVMNRAASRDQSLMKALSGDYYPTSRPGSSHNPAYVGAINEAWKGGTDTIHGATGNASGTVGFGVHGGHYDKDKHWVSPNQTARIGGERFGYEQKDLNRGWLDKYNQLKSGNSAIAHVD